ncbi:MAG: HVO_A0114 family putative DNA-binding protein [Candidatus Bathycorpusculaceae bacterium]
MFLKIVRNLTSDEILERIRKFEKESGMSFEKFEELFLRQKLDAKLTRAYFEWAELVDSYKGYMEEGTVDYVIEEIKDFKPEQAALLTPKRMELLCQLATLRVESINDLAQKVRRKVKNVYQDLKVLSKFGFVKLNKRKGRAIIPETLVKEITFLIR